MSKVSILICTYNRQEILSDVLEHTFTKVKGIKDTEVVIVDNNSTDETKEIVAFFQKENRNLRYVFEPKQGLSIARNRGWQEATGEYVLYLDDDALADENLLLEINNIMANNKDIKALGGIYTPWYRYGRPQWYMDEYVTMRFSHNGVNVLQEESWTGCIMLIKRVILKDYPFDPNLGMTGKKIFYGEETELQKRLEAGGIPVYGSNSMIMKHVVQPYKLDLRWFFKRRRAQAKSMKIMNNGNAVIEFFKGVFIGSGLAIVGTIVNVFKLVRKDYYWENYLIDTYTKPYKWWVYALENIKS